MIDVMTFLPAALLAAAFVGLSKGGLPMIGTLAVPTLAFYIDPLTAAALLLPIYLVSDVYGIWLYRASFSPRNLKILIPAGLLGILLGYLAAPWLSVAALNMFVGLIGLSFCARQFLGRRQVRTARPARVGPGIVWGALAGFTSFISHAGAPPYQTYILPQKLPKLTYAGTTTILFGILNFAKLPPYLALGRFPQFEAASTAALIATAMFGAWAGSKLTRIIPERAFFIAVQIALFALSVQLILKALPELLAA